MNVYREIQIPEPLARDITEPAPVIQWLSMDQLVIDERYQRPLQAANWTAIRKIAAEFMWSRFSAVLVAPIEGGRYAIIDGQHRVHAAAMIGIKQVPAMIVMIRAEEQAKAFVDVNTKRVTIHPTAIYKAALAAGEDWAVRSEAAVAEAGCRLVTRPVALSNRKPGDLMCMALVRDLVMSSRGWAVTTTLQGLRAFDEKGDVALYADIILKPLMLAVASFGALDAESVRKALTLRKPFLVIETAHRYAESAGTNKAQEAKNAFALMIKKASEGSNG